VPSPPRQPSWPPSSAARFACWPSRKVCSCTLCFFPHPRAFRLGPTGPARPSSRDPQRATPRRLTGGPRPSSPTSTRTRVRVGLVVAPHPYTAWTRTPRASLAYLRRGPAPP
jgi:hypothetical protein